MFEILAFVAPLLAGALVYKNTTSSARWIAVAAGFVALACSIAAAAGLERYCAVPMLLFSVVALVTFASAPDRKSTRLNSSHIPLSRMPSSA